MVSAKVGRWRLWLGILILLGLVITALVVASQTEPAATEEAETTEQSTVPLRGFNLSPRSFEGADFAAFFGTAAEYGNTLSWAGHYQDLTKTTGNAARTVIGESKKRDLTPVIIVGPNKGEVLDGVFVQGFRRAVLDFVAANEVPYLGLGNEIDEAYRDSPSRYSNLIATIQTLAADVRTASPQTKVFTIFQLERTKGLQGGLFGKKNDFEDNTWQLVTDLKNMDFVAFTTYPCLIYATPTEIPEEYYSDIQNHTDLPVIFTEIGWFRETPVTGWEANEAEQADFVSAFFELTVRLEPKLVIWPFLYDQKIAAPFQNMGLLAVDRSSWLGLTAWQAATATGTQP